MRAVPVSATSGRPLCSCALTAKILGACPTTSCSSPTRWRPGCSRRSRTRPSGSASWCPPPGTLGLLAPSALNCATLAAAEVNARRRHPRPAGRAGAGRRRPARRPRWPPRSPGWCAAARSTRRGRHARQRRPGGAGPGARRRRGAVRLHPAVRGRRAHAPASSCSARPRAGSCGPALDWLLDRAGPGAGSCSATTTSGRAGCTRPPAGTSPAPGPTWSASGTCRAAASTPAALVERSPPARVDAVLLSLIGSDLVDVQPGVRASPMAGRVPRLCGALEENGLLGVGGDATGELYAAMGYFAAVATDASLELRRALRRAGSARTRRCSTGTARAAYDGGAAARRARRAGRHRSPYPGAGRDRRRHPWSPAGAATFVVRDRHAVAAGLPGPGGRPRLRRRPASKTFRLETFSVSSFWSTCALQTR